MTTNRSDEARRYRILDVVGEGGFGKVYRARLEGAEGFAKDVAIKLLTDRAAPEEVLQRFRDESRILGLVRDRAVVTVDPPTRLDGRWAVVMEFVDGTNCHRLLKAQPIPPRAAVEIVQEVARALDNVFHQLGPMGQPLELIHRDIKPANIQVTPAGAVKVLDFGIARAQFRNREARTTSAIAGTFGYIAPERLEGINGPAGDVYSLGVVLAAFLCGRRPTNKTRPKILEWVAEDRDRQEVWALVEQMMCLDPEHRPTARQVEDACVELAPTLGGLPLRRWAETEVHEIATTHDDTLIGNVLTETMAHVPRLDHDDAAMLRRDLTQRTMSVKVLILSSLVGLLLLVFGVAGLAATVGYAARGWGAAGDAVPGRIEAASTSGVELQEPQPELVEPEPERVEPVSVEAEPVPVEPEPVPDPEPLVQPTVSAPVSPVPAQPAPEPAEPTPSPAPEAALISVTFGSVPFGATITIDGRPAGKAPSSKALSPGSHRVILQNGDDRIEKSIRVGQRNAIKYIWRGGDTWQAYY